MILLQAFVSEYAIQGEKDPGNATLYASLAEAAFLIGLEKTGDLSLPPSLLSDEILRNTLLCSDAVKMASYAPLFVNDNDRRLLYSVYLFYIGLHL
jgi:alpha-N-arabinofuranosidase